MPPKYRPPMWSSKAYGEPHGMWEKDAGAVAADDGRPVVEVTALRLAQMEQQLHAAVDRHLETQRNYVPQYLTKASALVRVLEVGDSNRPKDAGKSAKAPRWKKSGKIDEQTFSKLLERRLGLVFTAEEIAALYAKYGHDRLRLMPYEMFSRRLFASKAKILAMQGFQTGAYQLERPMEWGFNGMIKYPYCKQAVCPPSDWDMNVVANSARQPETKLQLEHVYGYSNSKNVAPNLFYCKAGVVYYTAAVGIVFDEDSRTQRFFLGHDDDIRCLALHPDLDTIATGQFGAVPSVLIWSAETTQGPAALRDPSAAEDEEIAPLEIKMPYGDQAVVACAFCGLDGRYLVTISTDDGNSVRVWNWKKAQNLANAKGYSGTPPQVFGVVSNPFIGMEGASPYDFVTCGVKHIYFWNFDPVTRDISSKNCVFDTCTQQDIYHAVFLPSGEVLSGGNNGGITFWRAGQATHEVKHKDGAHKGKCTVLKLRKDRLITAGADSKLIVWKLEPDDEGVMQIKPENDYILSQDDELGGCVVGMDCALDDDEKFIAGDDKNDIWNVDDDSEVLIQGQSGDVCGLAPHPLYPNIYATACTDGCAYIWNAETRNCICELPLLREADERGGKDGKKNDKLAVYSVAFSQQGDFIALGTCGVVDSPSHPDRGGVLVVYSIDTTGSYPSQAGHTLYFSRKMAAEAFYDLKFSPDGRMLAAACRDRCVHVFDVAKKKRVGHCSGHSSSVMHVDWSKDSQIMMSSSKDMELLFWERDRERRMAWHKSSRSQRDTAWETYTCPLGFTVMGVWQDDMDGTDINALDRSGNEQLVACCDDQGKVRLMNYPCVIDKAPHHFFVGHSSHVQNVRFVDRDRRLVSCGGRDRSLLQWKLDPPLEWLAPEPEGKAAASQKPVPAPATAKVGVSKNLQVELRVRELHSLVQMQKKQLAAKKAEITRLMKLLG